jgi:hypothetical protein
LIGWRNLMLPQLLDPRPYFANLPDPRRETRNKLHKLHDILMIPAFRLKLSLSSSPKESHVREAQVPVNRVVDGPA